MKKFKINWSETLYYEVDVETQDEDEAQEKFNELDLSPYVYDSQGGQDFEITEV